MRQRFVAIAALVVAALVVAAVPGPASAHHGWSAYNASAPIKVTAALSGITWGNPHGAGRVIYNGKPWAVVLAPTARMEARGLSEAALRAARSVTLEGYPRSDGTPEMRIERLTVDGKTIELR